MPGFSQPVIHQFFTGLSVSKPVLRSMILHGLIGSNTECDFQNIHKNGITRLHSPPK